MDAEDFYGDEAAPSDAQDTGEDMPEKDSADDGEQTALIDSSICPDMKVGDKLTLEITDVFDKEYGVKYIPEAKEEAEEGKPKSTMDAAEARMESMARPPSEG